jgi:hypothetical protein
LARRARDALGTAPNARAETTHLPFLLQVIRKHGRVSVRDINDIELRQVFGMIDADGSGEIDGAEFGEWLSTPVAAESPGQGQGSPTSSRGAGAPGGRGRGPPGRGGGGGGGGGGARSSGLMRSLSSMSVAPRERASTPGGAALRVVPPT